MKSLKMKIEILKSYLHVNMLTVTHGHTNFIFESFNTSMLYFKSSPRKLSRNNSSIQTEALSIFAAIGTIEYSTGTRYHRV